MSNLELLLKKRLEAETQTLQAWMDEVIYEWRGKLLVPENPKQVAQKLVSLERALAIFHESFESFVVVPDEKIFCLNNFADEETISKCKHECIFGEKPFDISLCCHKKSQDLVIRISKLHVVPCAEYKAMVYVPRKQLSEIVECFPIDMLQVEKEKVMDVEVYSLGTKRQIVDYFSKLEKLKELLETSGDCPKLITKGFWCGQHPSRLCKDIINTKGCTWGTDSK